MKVSEMNWMQIEAFLETDDRCVVPLGSTEQHAYVSLATDTTLAERVAVDSASSLGVPVFPPLAYGLSPYFMGYPGTVTLEPSTYELVVIEILSSIVRHGFRRVLIVNGHGGNSPVRAAVEEWATPHDGISVRWHDWWRAPRVRAAIDAIDPHASHASWMETFPWTRVQNVDLPPEHKGSVDLSNRHELTPQGFRDLIGDGSFGGWYQRPDAEMNAVWEVAVQETRSLLTEGW
jgi:creatinine amidohydrolase